MQGKFASDVGRIGDEDEEERKMTRFRHASLGRKYERRVKYFIRFRKSKILGQVTQKLTGPALNSSESGTNPVDISDIILMLGPLTKEIRLFAKLSEESPLKIGHSQNFQPI